MDSSSIKFADCHNDLLLGVLHQQERGIADPFGEFWLPQLKAGNVVTQILPVYTEEQYVGEAALRRTLLLFETAWQIAASHKSEVSLCLTGNHVSKAHDEGKIALILAVEGAEPVGHSVELFDTFYKLGVRILSLTWNRRTMFADGVGEKDTQGRLTSLGIDAIREMERVGIVLDVSHISENGFWHVSEVATKPFIATHSSIYELKAHPRNLKEAQAKRIIEGGGILCLNAFGGFLAENPTPESLIEHVKAAGDSIGYENVGFGFDFIRDLMGQIDPILGGTLVDISQFPFVPGLDRPADLARFGQLLIDSLGTDIANQVAWQNLTGIMERLLPQI